MAPASPRLASSTSSSAHSSPTASPRLGSPARLVRHHATTPQLRVVVDSNGMSSTTTTFSSPSQARPDSGSFMKKVKGWRHASNSGLDFGCAGEDKSWSQDGPADLGDRAYSSHSRAHSSSSDLSSSTVDSSLPPSPTPSCPSSFPILPPLSYCSRVPLTPRSEKRRGEEERAVEAVNDYFRRVRLSRVDEDAPSPSHPNVGMGIDIAYEPTPRSTFTPLNTSKSEEMISPRTKNLAVFLPSAPVSPRTSHERLRPTPAPLFSQPTITFLRPAESPFLEPLPSPIPETESEITCALEELSAFFSPPLSTVDLPAPSFPPPKHTRSASHEAHHTTHGQMRGRPHIRPRFASDGNIAIALAPSDTTPAPLAPGKKLYDWI